MKVEKKEDNYVKILGTCEKGKYPLLTGKEAMKNEIGKFKRYLSFKAKN